MHSGIIIVFNNDEKNINVDQIVDFLNKNNFKTCFVNNASSDKTMDVLKRIKVRSNANSNVFILDYKNNKGIKYAVKAGARFLLNESEFDFMIYLESNIVSYLKYIKEYFVQLAIEKKDFKPYPTRSHRNVLRDVYPYSELLKMNSSF